MGALSSAEMVGIWEQGLACRPVDRAALLASRARPDVAPSAVVELSLGAVTRALLRLRVDTFGPNLPVVLDCAECGERLEATLDAAALAGPGEGPSGEVEVGGWRLRPPSLADLAAIDGERDVERGAWRLFERCVVAEGGGAPDAAMLAAAEAALEALEPDADLSLGLACVACGRETLADLDIGALLWDEVAVSARRLLGEVHRLASAYGWTEEEIFSLGPARRAAYLAMVEG